MARVIASLVVIFFITGPSCSTRSFQQNIGIIPPIDDFYGSVDSIVGATMNQYNIPGLSIGVVRDDSILYAKGYGVRSIASNEVVTENSVFHTASISKIFTAIAIMQLVDQGKLALDDRLVDVLSDLVYRDDKVEDITINPIRALGFVARAAGAIR